MSYVPLTLSLAVTAGSDVTSLTITPSLASAVSAGDTIAIVSDTTSQFFVATGNAINSGTIGVESEVSTFSFPVGSYVVDLTTAVPQTTPITCSPDTLTLWNFLPPFVQTQDQNNNYPFLSWLEGIGSQQQIVDTLVRDTPTNVGWSIVFDITRCPTYALPWLAQFVGLRFSGPQLPSDSAMRAAIQAPGNWARGTPASVEQSAGVPVVVIERYPDPYSVTIIIPNSFTPLTYAELAAAYPTYPAVAARFPLYSDFGTTIDVDAIEANIEAALPAGLVPIFILD